MKFYISLVILLIFGAKTSFAQASYDTCAQLKSWEFHNTQEPTEAKKQYDTLRMYIERCAVSDPKSWRAFHYIDGAVPLYSSDTLRYETYRAWLISVLYLNTVNPEYFCSCLGSIMGTYQYGKYNATLAGMSILNYVRHIPSCYGQDLDKEFTHDSIYALEHGLNPNKLPPLDSLGLGFLLNQNGAISPSTPLPAIYLVSFTSTPNPFKAETTLSFELNRMAYVTVEVFDPLGRKVWGDDHGYSLDKGLHLVHLEGAKLSSGSYHARISTGFGEVKTVKLVKE